MSDSEAKRQASASSRLGPSEPSSPVESVVAPGDMIAGKFRVERVLGAGGMGVVVEARDVELEDRVAIKLLLPAALEQRDLVARFHREARAAVRIKSEHIARVIDVGSLDDGAPYIVMEYLEGYDLSKPTRNHGRLPIALAIDYILQASEAIAEAHAMGIVHRDIKPPNLFLTHRADGSPCIKVLDFGISKVVSGLDSAGGDAPEATLTQTSVVLGSPRYMAPEQISKPKTVDARADIWGIGTTLYRLITGHPPYEGNTLPEIFAAILMNPEGPPPVQQHCPEAPAELDAVLRKCMRINPGERWQNLGDLAAALAPFGSPAAKWSAERVRGIVGSAGVSANLNAPYLGIAPTSPASTSGAVMASTVQTSVSTNAGLARRNPLIYVVAALVSAVVLLAGLLFVRGGSQSSNVAPTASAVSTSTSTSTSVASQPPAVVSVAETAQPVAATAQPTTPAVSASASASATPATVKPRTGPAKPTATAPSGNGDDLFDERN